MSKFTKICGMLAVATLLPLGTAFAQGDGSEKKPAPSPEAKPEAKKETKKDEKKPEARPERRERRRGRFGRRGGRRGGFGRGMMDRAKKELGLTDDQVKKFEKLMQDSRKSMRDAFRKMREGGGFDRRAMREMWQKSRKDMNNKIKEIMTPEQFKKYQKMMQDQRGRWGRRGRGRRGRGQNTAQLKAEAVKVLKMSDEEKAVIVPMLDSVLNTRKLLLDSQRKRRGDFLKQVRETNDEEQLKTLLAKYRKAREEDKKTLKKAQAQLLEALTPVQEAKLVALNILD